MLACAGLWSAAAFAAGPFPAATDVRLGGDDQHTRLVIDLTDRIDVATFTLADPYRVVIDLPQINFQLPARAGDKGRGLIKAFRYGLIMQGGSRIVIDAKGPVKVEKSFVLAAADGQPARLVVDLAATDRDSFMRHLSLASHAPRVPAKPSLPAVDPGDPRPLVVIDPGHGGIDTGAKAPGNGGDEKTMVLNFALALRDHLEKSGKYRVALTRSDDTFIPLNERVRIARALKASLFVSIHADYLPKAEGEAQGATVYTLSEKASDAAAARLAEAENKADVIAGLDLTREPNDVADILIDLAQRETKSFSVQLARSLVTEMKTATRLHANPVRSAGFIVLRAPDVPSVLIELGYVSSKEDLRSLKSEEWRNRTAAAMARAIDTYFVPRLAGGRRAGGAN
ncbi:MAG: N-acetylmuramoyl-L-alanine amidase [Xanthobacteraceae bacterium]|uniref:N-acetylmuramoyl-L-alanine amidase n=1 Tax=Pseudolabrys sp. TaxID=1960880 RepID=UPI003D13C405